MNDEEEEALIEMFSKFETMKNIYMNIINASQNGVEAVIEKAGVPREKMVALQKEGERRARAEIKKGEISEK